MAHLRLQYSAISDVGRVRKDNQDSGYAGPWLLAICDGVGGAARGDIASSTAISQLRRLDAPPEGNDLLALVAGAIHRAHDRIGELVESDPALAGTSTTATVALFDGADRLAMGHLGDSRAYLLRDGQLDQLTHDHTFVQTLIDEGRVSELEARTHPHRNLILKAVDGVHDTEPDLFFVELEPGDRILLCSDGASGSLSPERLTELMSDGTPDFVAVELVRASLEAGSTDNVTCLVADAVPDAGEELEAPQPLLVGAAAELPRKIMRGHARPSGRLRLHRTEGGEHTDLPSDLPPEAAYAIENDPIDPEHARYAPVARPRAVWLGRIMAMVTALGVLALAVGASQWWIQRQFYVGQENGVVTIYRGVDADLLGYQLSNPYQSSNLTVSELSTIDAKSVTEGMDPGSLEEARQTVARLYAGAQPTTTGAP